MKGIFALTAIPAWAVCFGFAVDTMWSGSPAGDRRERVLAACGLVCLDFGWLVSAPRTALEWRFSAADSSRW